MDDTDARMIALLRRDGRIPVAKLAAEIGLGRAATAARLERLRREGPITGFTAVLAEDVAPLPVQGVMTLSIEGPRTAEVVSALDRLPEVRTIHTTNGRWDLVCELGCRSLADLDAALRRIRLIRGVANSETSLYLTTKRSSG
ncbi:Lrp/AsnC family transcriptional regulator [Jannaschia sp. Os4]|uniref:Lrp/AsnC family transcriptional regulator n=1 Tax=Jannaschia sp. Os4 TaxID=2807617 RepID=UPI00193A62AD|nr:Lrp/AsnC family transcriptional regulator [Jannaschia sp. Os4]MBM2577555.1 Lrp/AsnC family transcriptional regulator [Jannaschia sp. Os4]